MGTPDPSEVDPDVIAAQERGEDPDGDPDAEDPGTAGVAPRTEANADAGDQLGDVDDGTDDDQDLDEDPATEVAELADGPA